MIENKIGGYNMRKKEDKNKKRAIFNINVNVNKKSLITFFIIVFVLAIIGIAVAIGSGNPTVNGHDYSEINIPTTCINGQVLKWNGAAWACGNDNSGSLTFNVRDCTLCADSCGNGYTQYEGDWGGGSIRAHNVRDTGCQNTRLGDVDLTSRKIVLCCKNLN